MAGEVGLVGLEDSNDKGEDSESTCEDLHNKDLDEEVLCWKVEGGRGRKGLSLYNNKDGWVLSFLV